MTTESMIIVNNWILAFGYLGITLWGRAKQRRAAYPDGIVRLFPAVTEQERLREQTEIELRKAAGEWYRPNAGLPANWDQMTNAEREQVYRRAMDESNARARANRNPKNGNAA